MPYKKTLLLITTTALTAFPLIALAQGGLQTVQPFEGTSSGTLMSAIRNIVNALLTFAAVVAVIYVIIGGVRYIVSQGDEDAQVQARNTIIYAVIGIIVIALSAVIINFVLANL
jgi:hypothetical protein